jgi:hypothetical protein
VVRAEAQAGARASAWAFDARTARQALQRASSPRAGRVPRARGLGPPSRPALAIPWRDATAGLRAPGRMLGAAVVACGAGALAIAAARHPAADAIAPLGTYLAAGIVLEPLRLEVDHPSTSQILLRRPWGRVLLAHVAVPVAVVATATALAGAVVAAVGDLPTHGGAIVVVAVAIAPTIVLCAALSARHGGRVPMSVLAAGAAGDPTGGGGTVIAWWVRWPIAATVLAGLALLAVRPAAALSNGLPVALVIAAVAPAVLGVMMVGSER